MDVQVFTMKTDFIKLLMYAVATMLALIILRSTWLKTRSLIPTVPKIPKRIHQIWNDDIVPAEFAEYVKGLVKDNPDWEYYFWTKTSGLLFLEDKFPELYARVHEGASDVMRADFIRYAALYEYGGAYFDLDTASVRPLDNYVSTHECSLALEPAEHYIHSNSDYLLTNAALLCKPRHPFFHLILTHLSTLPTACTNAYDCSGPAMLTEKYKLARRYQRDKSVLQTLSKAQGKSLSKITLKTLPDIERSETFQDVYDVSVHTVFVNEACSKVYAELKENVVNICKNWLSRGKDKRTLSPLALTHHTWFHVDENGMTIVNENKISLLVPHVKIYGKDF